MQPVVRSLSVLHAVAAAPNGIALVTLSQQEAIPIASMHRILAVLSEHQYVVRSRSTRRYHLGPAAREITGGTPMPKRPNIVHPALTQLAKQSGETAFVTELVDGHAVCVSLVEGLHPLRLFVRVGQEMPLHAAASARVLLAGLSDHEIVSLLGQVNMPAFTTTTPTTTTQLLQRVHTIRSMGYDVCDNELDRDVVAVSAPIRAAEQRLTLGGVTVIAPLSRVPDLAARDDLIGLVTGAAEALRPRSDLDVVDSARGL